MSPLDVLAWLGVLFVAALVALVIVEVVRKIGGDES